MSLRTKTLPALLGSRGEVIDPPLPATTGGWFAKSTDVLRADTAHIDQSLKNFKARTAQTRAMTDLIESRIGLARVMTDLSTLAEICATHFLKGRRQRASDLATHGLRCQLQETDARIALSLAQRHLATWPAPGSEPKPPRHEGRAPPTLSCCRA